MNPLKIHLVDDHSLFREGLRFLLSNLDFVDEIYESESGEDFLKELANHPVDLVILDIELPKMNGIETAQKALEIYPELKIIALSMYSDENYYSNMIEAGAGGFLLKNSKFEEVKKAIMDVSQGKNYFSLEILQAILNRVNSKKNTPPGNDLTEREAEILYYICKGNSNSEIANQLCISKRTVDKHRENLLQKTGSKNTANLVIYAIKNQHFSL